MRASVRNNNHPANLNNNIGFRLAKALSWRCIFRFTSKASVASFTDDAREAGMQFVALFAAWKSPDRRPALVCSESAKLLVASRASSQKRTSEVLFHSVILGRLGMTTCLKNYRSSLVPMIYSSGRLSTPQGSTESIGTESAVGRGPPRYWSTRTDRRLRTRRATKSILKQADTPRGRFSAIRGIHHRVNCTSL